MIGNYRRLIFGEAALRGRAYRSGAGRNGRTTSVQIL